jgi:hypothetical protein
VDKVQYSNGTGNFAPLDSASGIEYADGVYLTAAKYVISFENYLILGYTTESGSTYPQRIRWCKLGDQTEWKSGDAGAAEVGQADFLTALDVYQGFCIIFKENSYYKMWLVPSAEVFNIAAMYNQIGCRARDSIVHDATGDLFFLASDYSIRSIRGERISDPIDKTMKQIAPEYAANIRAHFNVKYGELWWSIPYGGTATTNNRILIYAAGKWSFSDMAISAFGSYGRQAVYTWATLPYTADTGGWPSWAWDEWLDPSGAVDFLIELAADYSGYTWGLNLSGTDMGAAMTGYAVLTTDLMDKGTTDIYKRIIQMKVYVRTASGSLSIEIKRDNEFTWQTLGSASLVASSAGEDIKIVDVPCDFRARNFLIKITGTSSFSFIGVIIGYVSTGGRR